MPPSPRDLIPTAVKRALRRALPTPARPAPAAKHAASPQGYRHPAVAFPAGRGQLMRAIEGLQPILEIGPFDRPMVQGPHVAYFDVLDQAGLREKAAENPRRTGTVPHIDFVSPTGDLSVVEGRFAAACSAHCIEHQPDLIAHLTDLGRLLHDGGLYVLAVPDKRYCFDHFIPQSSVADAIAARGNRLHTLSSVLNHKALATHNEVKRHWAGDHENPGYRAGMTRRIAAAIDYFDNHQGEYIDAHAWRFTPQSFAEILSTLHETGYSPFAVERVHETPEGRVEFVAILRKAPSPRAPGKRRDPARIATAD
ncbi:hypothetical protein MLD63_01440 (plasmid) [Paracoccus sp. TK19116]|uniref:Methyltransferase domain-containing protein n=1 Tax=Paracoccus albicereus TaxID=2922394 RepID=A0ABT1MLD2_9RHOB|nr:hypothetical protein [Paracoccus albicereus]MCQ0969097.1 hypothetical protein [Paracoccus albicereus]